VTPGEDAPLAALESDEGTLYRQIHPDLFKNGSPTSVNFRPGADDAGKLSIDRSSVWSARQAYEHFVECRQKASAGTWGFTVDEVASSELFAFPDPLPAERLVPENPAHAFVDFRGLVERKEIEAVARELKRAALDRGRLHP
jgi:hypothetical protein